MKSAFVRTARRRKRYLPCSRLSMDNQMPPRDEDPSEMTDFEKNTTFEELERLEQDSKPPDLNRISQERKKERPEGPRRSE